MGRAKRVIPKRMPEKLKTIRERLGFNFEEMALELKKMLESLEYPGVRVYSGNIHEFENGLREPMLPVLLAYSRLGRTILDVIVDDNQVYEIK